MGDDGLDRHVLLFAHGFWLNLVLVASIGAQNVLIIRQGLLREHLAPAVTACWLVDATVLTLGAVGFGMVLGLEDGVARAAAWAGAAFLMAYALQRLRAALGPSATVTGMTGRSRGGVVATALAISLFNPQLYLDAFVVVGGIAAPLSMPERSAFALGALAASMIWFAGFACAVAHFAHRFLATGFWRTVDLIACCSMIALALGIVWHHDLLPRARLLLEGSG